MLRAVAGAVLVCGVLVAAACASAGAHGKETCTLRGADSSFIHTASLYRDCAVDQKARLITTNVIPDYRPGMMRSECVSAEVEFVVDTMGRAESASARVLHASNSQLGDAVLAMLTQLRYEPALLNGKKVRQLTTEKRSVATAVVVVPAGSGPPTRSGAGRPPGPAC